jgi:DNA polymerase III sliding clamp (beta) subunit (PCNA family)
MISFGLGGRRLTARLIGGEFIRYRARFPSEFGCRADVPAAPFIEAVRRVSLVADRASPVRLMFTGGQAVIEAQTEGRARAVETVPADFRGDEPSIAFNPHYLLDGLTAAAAGGGRPHAAGAEKAGGPADSGAPVPPEGSVPPAGSADPGLLRIEFTSPAKPALITRVEPAGGDGPLAGQEQPAAEPEFRYLVVPLRATVRS